MPTMTRTSRLTATWQEQLLLFVVLGHVALLAFCSAGMAMDSPAAHELGLASAGPETGTASALAVCSVSGGDCYLNWSAPISLSRTTNVLVLLGVIGSVWLLHEGGASPQLARHTLDPPRGVRLQALLQVFRL
jgi:hypothetical protein